jgi:tetratricopeptide (TPR) repeat protein
MPDVDSNKSVFISYRRDLSKYLARAIFMDLREHGYDTFLDVETIDSGDWETFILNQIAARTHFLLILTPGTLDRCLDPQDMVRREIEHAIRLGRNVIPMLVDEFKFATAQPYLVGRLSALPQFNAMRLPDDYFDEAMHRLRSRFLKPPVYHPAIQSVTPVEETQADALIDQASNQPLPTKSELRAEILFYRALEKRKAEDLEGAIADYTEAIRLDPTFASAYNNRGATWSKMGVYDEAIADFNTLIRMEPQNSDAYYNRGFNRASKGDLTGAISDYSQALRLNPGDEDSLVNRAETYYQLRQYAKAFADFVQLNDRTGGAPASLAGLAVSEYALGNSEAARQLWQGLVDEDRRYRNVEWVREKFNWADALVEAAWTLISALA